MNAVTEREATKAAVAKLRGITDEVCRRVSYDAHQIAILNSETARIQHHIQEVSGDL
mgnify:CR=1 FL=1